ncbi:MAG: choice-of-anchor tandem repeat GloVer-containing protein [Candidatus Cybelea sp.]
MDRFNLGPGVLSVCVAAALLAGCGVLRQAQDDMQPPTGVPGAVPHDSALARTNSTNYKVLYSFGAAPDGNSPRAGLIDAGGVLYGTTREGGSHECYDYSTSAFHYTCGTVFRITTGGTEKVLYSFGEDPDANAPNAALVDVGGTLYGTTELGGSYICGYSDTGYYPCGALFSVTKGGTEKVLHSFGSGLDGATPQAGLIDVGGTLYGTTSAGGLYTCGLYVGGCGTVFSITLGGSVKVLHNFNGTDGARPAASLIRVQGMLYGTTTEGGAYGGGTVFSLTTGGTENVLHSFGKGTDGSKPSAGLIDVQGMLYGTTRSGGGSPSCTSG